MAHAQSEKESLVKWYSFEEAVELSKETPKKMFIDVYTDWCGWCKVMDKSTFNDPIVAEYLNDNYYPVKLNAEQREDIVFDGQTFKYVGEGKSGVHELAYALTQGKLSYPTVVFLDENQQLLQPLPGYRKAKELDPILRYFVEGFSKDISWEDYQKDQYKSPF